MLITNQRVADAIREHTYDSIGKYMVDHFPDHIVSGITRLGPVNDLLLIRKGKLNRFINVFSTNQQHCIVTTVSKGASS